MINTSYQRHAIRMIKYIISTTREMYSVHELQLLKSKVSRSRTEPATAGLLADSQVTYPLGQIGSPPPKTASTVTPFASRSARADSERRGDEIDEIFQIYF